MSTLNDINTKSQCELILNHLKSGKSINPLYALNQYGCFRLGARIYDLKQSGYQIDKQMIKTENGKKYASYSLRVN
ncbi:helix-turn-helix domain-containing protein [Orbus mooreae]|uniref:helix-turn-helix domain-containing protein n=1 Tax=Orbus mooreae TaxID=3074107 RepID=UPI00370D5E8D